MRTDLAGGRRPAARRGIVLMVVLVVVILLLVSLHLVNGLMRQQHLQVHRYAMGEVAYHLAWAGAEVASRRVFHEASEKRSGFWFEALCRTPAARCDFEEALDLPVFAELLRDHEEARLEVRVRLARFEPLDPKRHPSGLLQDPIEKRGRLEIESTCRYRGLVRRVRRGRDVRVIASALAPLGKFVLLVEDPTLLAEKMNALGYVSADGVFFDAERKKRAWPFVVSSAAGPPGGARLRTEGGGLASAREQLDPKAFLGNGWVFLGGDRRIFLNLVMGNGFKNRDEEHFLLRRVPYRCPSPVFGEGIEEKVHLFGVAHGIWDMPMFSRMGRGFRDPETDGWIGDGTALLHLSGDGLLATPTLVLGNVHRRYGRFVKLKARDRPTFTSFVYADEAYYPKVRSVFERLTSGDWSRYRRIMARPEIEPYNRSYDFLVTNDEQGEDPGGVLRGGRSPVDPPRLLLARALAPVLAPLNETNETFLYPDPDAPGSTATGAVRIADRGGRDLFQGDLNRVLHRADSILNRISWVVDGKTFRERFVGRGEGGGDELRLGGGVFCGGSEFTLGPCEVRRGGLVVTEKDLVVEGPLRCVEGQSLTLLSLDGNVRVKGSEELQAHLIALGGSLVMEGTSPVRIRGAVAMHHWDSPEKLLALKGRSTLTWDGALDPTDPARRIHQYQVAFEDALHEEVLRR